MFSWFACYAYPERVMECSAAEKPRFDFYHPDRQPTGKNSKQAYLVYQLQNSFLHVDFTYTLDILHGTGF